MKELGGQIDPLPEKTTLKKPSLIRVKQESKFMNEYIEWKHDYKTYAHVK